MFFMFYALPFVLCVCVCSSILIATMFYSVCYYWAASYIISVVYRYVCLPVCLSVRRYLSKALT